MGQLIQFQRVFQGPLDELPADNYYVKVGGDRWREATLSEVATCQRDGWPSVYRGTAKLQKR